MTEGPYWLNVNLVRRDITEGKAGVTLRVVLRIVSASTCLPIPNAVAEIWHCDASGIYSGVAAQNTTGQTFLRVIQVSDADGMVEFQTIYPGWYSGRTTHIHFKVHFEFVIGRRNDRGWQLTARDYHLDTWPAIVVTRFTLL